MKKAIAIFIVLLMCTVQSVALCDAHDVSIFDFVNVYETPATNPSLTDDELTALTAAPGDKYETEYATYTLEQLAYDGCNTYMMVSVVPKSDSTLLMSGYMYEPGDTCFLEDSDVCETFEEKAQRDNSTIIACGVNIDLSDGAICALGSLASEKYFADGSMLLELHFAFNESSEAPREMNVTIEEGEYGTDSAVYSWSLSFAPTASTQTAHSDVNQAATDLVYIDYAELMRSDIGALLCVHGHFADEISESDLETITSLDFNCEYTDDSIGTISSGLMCYDKHGNEMYIEDITGGESFVFMCMQSAGTELADSVNLTINDCSTGETLGEVQVELTALK